MNVPRAKGKIKRESLDADAEALKKHEETIIQTVVKSLAPKKGEIPTSHVVNVWADEIQAIYQESGVTLDDMNALDKALTLWRELHFKQGVHAKEKSFEVAACKEHE